MGRRYPRGTHAPVPTTGAQWQQDAPSENRYTFFQSKNCNATTALNMHGNSNNDRIQVS